MAAEWEAAPTAIQVLSRCSFQAGGAARGWLLLQSDGLHTQVTCQHSTNWVYIATDSAHGCKEMLNLGPCKLTSRNWVIRRVSPTPLPQSSHVKITIIRDTDDKSINEGRGKSYFTSAPTLNNVRSALEIILDNQAICNALHLFRLKLPTVHEPRVGNSRLQREGWDGRFSDFLSEHRAGLHTVLQHSFQTSCNKLSHSLWDVNSEQLTRIRPCRFKTSQEVKPGPSHDEA